MLHAPTLSASEAHTSCLESRCSKSPLAISGLGSLLNTMPLYCSEAHYVHHGCCTPYEAHVAVQVLTIFTWQSMILSCVKDFVLCSIFPCVTVSGCRLLSSQSWWTCPALHFLPSWLLLQTATVSSPPCLAKCNPKKTNNLRLYMRQRWSEDNKIAHPGQILIHKQSHRDKPLIQQIASGLEASLTDAYHKAALYILACYIYLSFGRRGLETGGASKLVGYKKISK